MHNFRERNVKVNNVNKDEKIPRPQIWKKIIGNTSRDTVKTLQKIPTRIKQQYDAMKRKECLGTPPRLALAPASTFKLFLAKLS